MNNLLHTFFQQLPISLPHQITAKTLAICFLLLLGFTNPASAQFTIDNSVFPVVGDTLYFALGNQPGAINQIFTPPGFDPQHWDLSGLQATQTWGQVMKLPQTGTNVDAQFPTATMLYNPINFNANTYLEVTGNQVKDLGYYGNDELGLGLSLLFKNVPPLEQSWAPINFFDIKQSASNVLTAFDAPIAPPVLSLLVPTADSFRIRVTYQQISTIDAWGTLTLPDSTYDVLRKKQTLYKSQAVDVKVAPLGWIDISTIGGQQLLPLGTDTITTFHFLNNVSKEPIAICTLNTGQNTVLSVQYKVAQPTPPPPSATGDVVLDKEHFSIYPNPAKGSITLKWEQLEDAHVEIVVSDVACRKMQTILDKHVPPGPQQLQYFLPPMPSGMYLVQVFTNGVLRHSEKLSVL
ncbi:MAG: hypothetical protein GC192_03990 [Bacteroidetes bacterium]|nr:hypothetical protein [Bacteroidota bacterium]